jgi:ABC transport system ATP-binding/permease protein
LHDLRWNILSLHFKILKTMNLLSAEQLSVYFGERVLFENLSFGIDKGDKTALIAGNGTGKTTLLNILAGLESPDKGSLVLRDGTRTAYLMQDPKFDESLTVAQTVHLSNAHILSIIESYNNAISEQALHFSDETRQAAEHMTKMMDLYQAWDYEQRMTRILTKLQIVNLEQLVSELSGGQRKRLALASVLIDDPDILLLDEPTNHMDIAMIEWLEEYLSQPGRTVFMVSHDRYFLDNVCNQIIEMEGTGIFHHRGNYVYYLEKSEERKAVFATEVEKAGQLYKKELEWMRTQPKARTHKSKSRIESFYQIEEKAKSGVVKRDLKLDMKMSRLGSKIMEVLNVCKSFDDEVIVDNFSYIFKKGERIGIVGDNGSGKTTFLNLLTGMLKPDKGRVITGETIRFGYFKQEGLQFDDSKKVIDVVKEIAEDIILSDGKRVSASQFLDFFLFPPKMQQNFLSKLSGGEKRRLHLLTVLIKNPNFLILDEPTNDLDLPTLNTLETFLRSFEGCLILVSHDRYFLDTLTDHLFVFEGNGVIADYYDTYTAFRERKQREDRQLKLDKPRPEIRKNTSADNGVKKATWKETKEFESLGGEIEQLELEKIQLETNLEKFAADPEKIMVISQRYAQVLEFIDEKSMRWLQLSEVVESK